MSRFLVLPVGFAISLLAFACDAPQKPEIPVGTRFEQVQPGSRFYRKIPADRPMITDFDQKR